MNNISPLILDKNRYEKIQEGLDEWTGYYRENLSEYLVDYYGMTWLEPFQKFLVDLINKETYSMIFASRGFGKTQLVAATAVGKMSLYPGIIITVAAGKRGQGTNLIRKIVDEFMPNSPNLRNEIEDFSTSPSNAFVKFKNTSIIRVVTARDSARSERTNWLIADEFVQITKNILDTVLRKFKAGARTPGFLKNPEYKDYPREPNQETYISSASFKHHYSWEKFRGFFKNMIDEKKYVCLGFPYQLPVSAGYYPEEQIRDEMEESDFNHVAWSIEMETLFFGESNNAFFGYDYIDAARKITVPLYPLSYYRLLKDKKIFYTSKKVGEIRLIGMDIAVMGGAKNDATCFTVLRMIPIGNGRFQREVCYIETLDGGHSKDQAIRLKELFRDFEADYVVVDTNGVGIGVYDFLTIPLIGEDGTEYRAWTCINDAAMADRCKERNALKVMYSIKASADFNHKAAVFLRDGLKDGTVTLLSHECDNGEIFNRSKQFESLSTEQQLMFQDAYNQTTLLVYEMVNLNFEQGTKIRLKEASGMRKDRYSSLSYVNYIAKDIEQKFKRPEKKTQRYSSQHICVSKVSFD